MNKVLIINASVRQERSHSRKLAQVFMDNWQSKYPEDTFIFREVGLDRIPPIDEAWIASAFRKPQERTEAEKQALRLSDSLLSELKDSDIYVIATPMYNWSIPSGLKSYIDQIMRINETWKFKSGIPDGNYVGLLNGKRLFILSSRGDTGYMEGEKNEKMNFQTTYLKFIFNMLAVQDVSIYSLDNEEFGGEIFERSKAEVDQLIRDIS